MDGTLTMPVHDFDAIRRQIDIPQGTPILEAIGRMGAKAAKKARQRLHQIEMELAALATPQPGAKEVLEHLASRDCTLGILTRNDEEIAEVSLHASGLDRWFPSHHIVGRETCHPKPSPAGVHHLLDLWGASAEKTVMIGDYLYDIQAGKSAGVRTIHFDSYGQFLWPEFTDFRITSVWEIFSLLG